MNANENDPMHELLCAYILDETSEEQTREVEAALSASAELRTQRVELEQTIGLVKRGLGDNLSLSEEAMSTLVAAAAAPDQTASVASLRPWYASPGLRAAAGIVVALGGVWGVLALRDQLTSEATMDVALSDSPLPASAPGADAAVKARRFGGRVSGEREVKAAIEEAEASKGRPIDGKATEGRLEATRPLVKSPALATGGGGGKEATAFGPGSPSAGQPSESAQASGGGSAPTLGRRANQALPDLSLAESLGSQVDNGVAVGKVLTLEGPDSNDRYQYAGPGEAIPLAESDKTVVQGGNERFRKELRADDLSEPELADSIQVSEGKRRGTAEGAGGDLSRLPALGRANASDDFLPGYGHEEPGAEPEDGRRQAPKLSVEELRKLADRRAERIYLECRRRPGEAPRDMFFRFYGDNAFVSTRQDRLSTFAADVDTASYALARRYLEEGRLPTKAQIRTEEFVNYAKPDLTSPTKAALSIHTELAPSLFGGKPGRLMLRVGIRGQEVGTAERKPLSLTFAIDVSGSMKEGQRLELVKHAIRLLVAQLHEGDKVGLVAYSREARLVLPMTDASERDLIESALHPLSPNGGTNAEAGLRMAYELALTSVDPAAHSRVILLSDGVANIGTTDQDRINQDVTRHREAGIYLNTIGVGMNNHNDVFLEQLANKGDGICDYVDDEAAVRRAIVERFTGALIPIAGDVKIQVEFDPTQVHAYRLLGYENRAVADADFRNDAVDAGEIGAGHQVVALYELDMVVGEGADKREVGSGSLATVRLRWKAPKVARQHPLEIEVTEIGATVDMEGAHQSFAEASAGYRRSILTAQLAEFLRRSSHAREDSFRVLDDQTARLAKEEGDEDSHELANLVKRTMALGLPLQLLDRTGVDLALDEYQRYLYMRAQLDDLERAQDRRSDRELKDLDRRTDELEKRLRERIYTDLEQKNG